MSKYTQEQETEIVRDAMTLTAAIQIGENELSKLRNEKYPALPSKPVHRELNVPTVAPQIPPAPRATYTFSEHMKTNFNKVLYLTIFCWPVFLFILAKEYFVNYYKALDNYNMQLSNSPEYLKRVEEAKKVAAEKQERLREQTAKQQAEIDAQYQVDLEHYNTVVVPAYNQERDDWKTAQTIKIEMLEEELQLNKDTLEALYESTRLISLTYRKLEILRWLYDDMSTSDHNIRYATELLDRDRQREVTLRAGLLVKKAVDEMHSSMVSGFNAIYDAVDAGNVELAKMRRDQNLANTIGIIQRHNLNKMVKAQNGILERNLNR